MELHLQVKEARKQAKLTQGELADRARVGRKDISRFENGENVTMKTFLRIVGALPNLTQLMIGSLELVKEGSTAAPAEGAAAQDQAAAVLERLRGATPAATNTPPAGEPGTAREMSLLRTLGWLLVEITGGGGKFP